MYSRNFKSSTPPQQPEKKGETLSSKYAALPQKCNSQLEEPMVKRKKSGSSPEKIGTGKNEIVLEKKSRKAPPKNTAERSSKGKEPYSKSKEPQGKSKKSQGKNDPYRKKDGPAHGCPPEKQTGIQGLIGRFMGEGGKSLLGLPTQDLLLMGLIFILSMEEGDDDLLLVLLALLFVNSGEG